MITHIDITGVRYQVDDVTRKYVLKKIGRLDRFLPRHARKSAQADVVLKEVNRANGNKYECHINLLLPQKTITAQDSTLNMLAAVDIVEAKLTSQLKKYHDDHTFNGGRAQRVLRSIKERVKLSTNPIEA